MFSHNWGSRCSSRCGSRVSRHNRGRERGKRGVSGVTVHASNSKPFGHFKSCIATFAPGGAPGILHEPVIGAAFWDWVTHPAARGSASVVACDVTDHRIRVIHVASRTLCVGYDARFVISVGITKGIESDREWCCRHSPSKSIDTTCFSKEAGDLSPWKEKVGWPCNSSAIL